MSCVFCDISVADNHPARLRHQHGALGRPAATVKGALHEFTYKQLRIPQQARDPGSAKSMGAKAHQLTSWHRDAFPLITGKVCFAADAASIDAVFHERATRTVPRGHRTV